MELPQVKYTGAIRQVTVGTGPASITVGGQGCFAFHSFEGEIPNPPVIAYEIWDSGTQEWPEVCRRAYGKALDDPVAWARHCRDERGARILAVYLVSTDPTGLNRSSADAAKMVERIAAEVNLPLIVWGCGQIEKDAETLRLVAEACQGKNLALGPAEEKNYKQIGAAAIAYGHCVIASSPIDVNLAKQLNILLLDLGVPEDRIVMDPTTGALGYGIEYTYSVMERDRIAALQQQDDKLAFPMVCFLGKEVWKTKEASLPSGAIPALGTEERGIVMEAMTAALLALAGADILVMRHPKAMELFSRLEKEL